MRDPLPSLEPVKSFIRQHLVECAREVLHWRGTGGTAGPVMKEVAALLLCVVSDTADPMPVVEHLVEQQSLECAAELAAWRSHFPHHTFRRDGACITLKTTAA